MAAEGKRRRRRCRFCAELFQPDPRLKGKQYACGVAECQRQRMEGNRRRWLARHPDYFEGRYPKTRAWLDSHPGYLARYRREHPETVRRDNEARRRRHLLAKAASADIQVAKTLQAPVSKALAPVLAGPLDAAIQDSIFSQVVVAALYSAAYLFRARAAMQDPIAPRPVAHYAPGHGSNPEASPQPGASPQGPALL